MFTTKKYEIKQLQNIQQIKIRNFAKKKVIEDKKPKYQSFKAFLKKEKNLKQKAIKTDLFFILILIDTSFSIHCETNYVKISKMKAKKNDIIFDTLNSIFEEFYSWRTPFPLYCVEKDNKEKLDLLLTTKLSDDDFVKLIAKINTLVEHFLKTYSII